jgi:hypothetical protein
MIFETELSKPKTHLKMTDMAIICHKFSIQNPPNFIFGLERKSVGFYVINPAGSRNLKSTLKGQIFFGLEKNISSPLVGMIESHSVSATLHDQFIKYRGHTNAQNA